MADMSASTRDRGQMILVGAFALSMTFVALALLLNSAVYTENLASRSIDAGASEAIEFREEARAATVGILEYLANDGSGTFEENLAAWTSQTAKSYAANGISVSVLVESPPDSTYSSAQIEIAYRGQQVQYVTVVEVNR